MLLGLLNYYGFFDWILSIDPTSSTMGPLPVYPIASSMEMEGERVWVTKSRKLA